MTSPGCRATPGAARPPAAERGRAGRHGGGSTGRGDGGTKQSAGVDSACESNKNTPLLPSCIERCGKHKQMDVVLTVPMHGAADPLCRDRLVKRSWLADRVVLAVSPVVGDFVSVSHTLGLYESRLCVHNLRQLLAGSLRKQSRPVVIKPVQGNNTMIRHIEKVPGIFMRRHFWGGSLRISRIRREHIFSQPLFAVKPTSNTSNTQSYPCKPASGRAAAVGRWLSRRHAVARRASPVVNQMYERVPAMRTTRGDAAGA